MAKVHNDEPTLNDQLGRTELIQRMAKTIAEADPPQVFGLHGDWGTGKTSALHQLHWHLVGECPQQEVEECEGLEKGEYKESVTVVWFEAWRYQYEAVPIVALLQEIRTQLPWTAKALKESKKLMDVGIRGALLSLEHLTKGIGFQASKIQQAGEQWESENLATRLPSQMIREHLEAALGKLLGESEEGEPPQRLVVLVDDLDRCESKTAYHLLEGIKIYLNLPNCVFVLGMNQEIIEGAVAEHLPQPDEADPWPRRRMAKRYLEKLCQNIWHVPLVEEPAELTSHYLEGLEPIQSVPVCQVLESYPNSLPPVPRKIKGFANLLIRFEGHLQRVQSEAGTEHIRPFEQSSPPRWAGLVIVHAYLYHFHHRLYRLLWKEGREFWRELFEWCQGRPTRLERHMGSMRLRRMPEELVSDKAPTPESTGPLVLQFHDPAADDVFHVAPLIVDLEELTEYEAALHLLR